MEKMTKMNAFCKATVCQDCLKEFTKNNSLTRQMLFLESLQQFLINKSCFVLFEVIILIYL